MKSIEDTMKSIKVTTLEAFKLEGGDAGDQYDAVGEAIILSVQEDKIVRLRTGSITHIIDPLVIRDAVAEVKNPAVDEEDPEDAGTN